VEGQLPALSGATGWINSPPLTPAGLRGKVVLIDFWTYSCINCLRSLPYVNGWYEKYEDHGLVVIGVHSPEFAFEKDVGNVKRAVHDLNVTYPVALDSNYEIWRAFDNQYWPAHYFIDALGRIRGHHFGEGDYPESEGVIRELLTEAGFKDLPPAGISVAAAQGVQAAADEVSKKEPALGLKLETDSAEKLKTMGVKVVDGVDKSGFIKAAAPIQDQLAKELGPHAVKILELVRNVK